MVKNIALQENNANWNAKSFYRVDISIRYEKNWIVIYTYQSGRGTTEFESAIMNRLFTVTMHFIGWKPPIKEIVAIMDVVIMNVQFPNRKNVKRDHMNPVGE